jgi:uncharacterized protein
MKIAIAGSTGFIGTYVSRYLHGLGHEIVPMLREDFSQHNISFRMIGCDAVINLTGSPVLRIWNTKAREHIFESRIDTTSSIVHTISVINHPPKLLINISAVGFYNDSQEQTETDYKQAHGFLAEVIEEWEDEATKGIYSGTRVVIARLGVVLGKNGGILKKLHPMFRFGLGTILGNGKQKMSYIHIHDLARAMEYFINNETTNDVYNLTTPNPVTNKEFSKKLAASYKKKVIAHAPAFLLKLRYGEASSFLLKGQHVLPKRLTESGFTFQFPDIDSCLKDLVK